MKNVIHSNSIAHYEQVEYPRAIYTHQKPKDLTAKPLHAVKNLHLVVIIDNADREINN